LAEIKEIEDQLRYSRELLAGQKIAPGDYCKMKVDLSNKLERLEARLSVFSGTAVII
jgi:hypothetical protein